MSAYLYTASVTQRQVRPVRGSGLEQLQVWDSALSAIVYGGDAQQAQKRFEAWCHLSPEGPHPLETQLGKIVGAEIIDQMLTEAGSQKVDWPELSRRVADMVLASAVDDFEQGYWVDANQVVPPASTRLDADALKRELAEDVRSGVNWAPDKKFFFLVSVLGPPRPPPELRDEFELESPGADATTDESGGESESDEGSDAASELRDLEAAAVVEARNSVVAAWLWRKYAATTPLASNEIHVGQVCEILAVV